MSAMLSRKATHTAHKGSIGYELSHMWKDIWSHCKLQQTGHEWSRQRIWLQWRIWFDCNWLWQREQCSKLHLKWTLERQSKQATSNFVHACLCAQHGFLSGRDIPRMAASRSSYALPVYASSVWERERDSLAKWASAIDWGAIGMKTHIHRHIYIRVANVCNRWQLDSHLLVYCYSHFRNNHDATFALQCNLRCTHSYVHSFADSFKHLFNQFAIHTAFESLHHQWALYLSVCSPTTIASTILHFHLLQRTTASKILPLSRYHSLSLSFFWATKFYYVSLLRLRAPTPSPLLVWYANFPHYPCAPSPWQALLHAPCWPHTMPMSHKSQLKECGCIRATCRMPHAQNNISHFQSNSVCKLHVNANANKSRKIANQASESTECWSKKSEPSKKTTRT